MKKPLSMAYLIAFVLLFIAPTLIYGLIGDKLDIASGENRTFAEKPAFSLQSIEEFPVVYESYYNDSLPFRNQMIRLNNLISYHLFHQVSDNRIIFGKESWLFYDAKGTDGDTIADYQGRNLYSEDKMHQIAEHLLDERDALRRMGKEFAICITPSKESIYGNDYLPDYYVRNNTYTRADQLMKYLQSNTDLTIIYPKEALLTAIAEDPQRDYYLKTDTHWNNLGGYIGAYELLTALNVPMPQLQELQITVEETNAGDIARMTGIPERFEYDPIYTVSGYPSDITKCESFAVKPDMYIHNFEANANDSRSLFVIRDSYSLAMMNPIASQFSNCTFAHRSIYTPDLLEQYPSDIVVIQLVERFMYLLDSYPIT